MAHGLRRTARSRRRADGVWTGMCTALRHAVGSLGVTVAGWKVITGRQPVHPLSTETSSARAMHSNGCSRSRDRQSALRLRAAGSPPTTAADCSRTRASTTARASTRRATWPSPDCRRHAQASDRARCPANSARPHRAARAPCSTP